MLVNEIFYSLQGEGFFTGTPSVFVRLSGCNLKCPFCDTDHQQGTEMSEMDIANAVAAYPAKHVVVTGGEPSMQLTASLIDLLHQQGYFVAVETNGTRLLPPNVDWITLSPKSPFVPTAAAQIALTRCDELKMVFTGTPPPDFPNLEVNHHFLQPCDTGNAHENCKIMQAAVSYCLANPKWRLSLQTHKILNIQ